MDNRLQKRAKSASNPTSTSEQTGILMKQRAFSVQSDQVPVTPHQHQTPDLQTGLDKASRCGHNLGRMALHGNRSAAIQPKLTIGQPGDKYEQEADRVADRVMAMSLPTAQQQVQRQEATEEDEQVQTKSVDPANSNIQLQAEEEVQTKSSDAIAPSIQLQATEEEEIQTKLTTELNPTIQRQEATEEDEQVQTKSSFPQTAIASNSDSQSLENRLSNSKGSGNSLSNEVRAFMEPRFGVDFGQVRVHTSSEAVQMNRELNAQAFAHGRDIYFGAGKYNPGSDEGKRLLAHELTHVVQQTGGQRVSKSPQSISATLSDRIQGWRLKKPKWVEKAQKRVTQTVKTTVNQGKKKFKSFHSKALKGIKQAGKFLGNLADKFLPQPLKDLKNLLLKVLSGGAIAKIITNPIAFAKNLFHGFKQGFQNFLGSVGQHLENGLKTFLFGELGNTNIKLPPNFNVEGILSIATQMTGLSYDKIRTRTVDKLGEQKVSLIEQGASAAKSGNAQQLLHNQTDALRGQAVSRINPEQLSRMQEAAKLFQAFKQGPQGILQYFNNLNFGELTNMVLTSLKTYLMEQVLQKAVIQIMAYLVPGAGWIKGCIDAIRVMYSLFIERAQQVKALTNSFTQSIVNVANRAIGTAAKTIEGGLAQSVPLLIGVLADYLGLGDIAKKIKAFFDKGSSWVKQNVLPVADQVIDKVASFF